MNRALSIATALIAVFLIGLQSHAVSTSRVSLSNAGKEADRGSYSCALSTDGRYVAFTSWATNLVRDDTNDLPDVFVRDVKTQRTSRVSVGFDHSQSNGMSMDPAMSSTGRYVAFTSYASNLVPADTNRCQDVFVFDRMTRQTTRVSVASDGTQSNRASGGASISPDGRYVAFSSAADNLVPGDTNISRSGDPASDVFVHDRRTGVTRRVSVATDGTQGNWDSWGPSISLHGRFVAFTSMANNFDPRDTNGAYEDVFVHDLQTGTTELITAGVRGVSGDEGSFDPCITPDGRYVAFSSFASDLVPVDENGQTYDVFVHDRRTGETALVSISSDGRSGDDFSWGAGISMDGRYVSFESFATNLVPDDTNWSPWGGRDVFVHDRWTGRTERASVADDGTQADGESARPRISSNGRYVAFESLADNLCPGDTNGESDIFIRDRWRTWTRGPGW